MTDQCTECDKPPAVAGMCRQHYMRQYRRTHVTNPNPIPRTLWATTIHAKSAHARCRALWGPAAQYQCVECGRGAREWAYDGTDPTALYRPCSYRAGIIKWVLFSRFPEFYMPMCISCHRQRDMAEATQLLHDHRVRTYGGNL